MFKNFGLGTKIILGFLAVVALVAVAGVSGFWGVQRVGNALHVVANEEAPVVDASMGMMLAVSAGKMLGDELKGATSVMASDDASQIGGITKAFDAATEKFDTFAGLILEGGDFEGGIWIETDNEELATAIRQTEELHDKKFQPAFKSLVETGQKLLATKTAAHEAMETAEQEYNDLAKNTATFEEAVSAEISKSLAAADTVEAARSVVTEEVPLADCAMEIKFAIAQSRMVMEEIAQARTEAEIDAIIPEYDQSIKDFDKLITAVLNGGTIDGLKIVATDNDDVRKSVETLNTDHGHFEKAATEMIAKQRRMITMVAESDKIMSELDAVGEEMDVLLAKVEGLAGAEMDKATKDGETAKATVVWSLIAIVIVSVVTGLCIGIFLTRSITKVLNRIVSSLAEGSEQVTSAAGQVSASSQSLAEGATEQAAGLEETSSSLEEMSSMTKQNADNAQQANTLASEARKAADTGSESMSRMNHAIQDIQKSSDETAKIIKVIDEIAFQTNLLALNAAVEAARAGEAGKGFAVVAEEVRNLAMRSAEAAKNTSALIEESVKNSKNGVDIATEVAKVLEEIVGGIGKTSDLVGEIAAASQEQAQGIEQVNTAVSQMDKVTQQNAANAEESASASEELSAQAEQMNGVVNELRTLVGGRNTTQTTATTARRRSTLKTSDHAFHQIAGKASATTHKAKTKVSPDRVIPLGDSDSFDDFNS